MGGQGVWWVKEAGVGGLQLRGLAMPIPKCLSSPGRPHRGACMQYTQLRTRARAPHLWQQVSPPAECGRVPHLQHHQGAVGAGHVLAVKVDGGAVGNVEAGELRVGRFGGLGEFGGQGLGLWGYPIVGVKGFWGEG